MSFSSILQNINYLFAMILCIIVIIIVLMIIYSDIKYLIRYLKAPKVEAVIEQRVIENDTDYSNYGTHARTKYYAYKVKYYLDNQDKDDIVLLRKNTFNVGDKIFVRIDNSGIIDVRKVDRIKILLIAAPIGILYSILIYNIAN